MVAYDPKLRMRTLFNGFLLGLGFGCIILGGQGLFLVGAVLTLIGGSLEKGLRE